MALFRNLRVCPVKCLPNETQSLFLWGQSAELLVRRTTCTPPRNSLIWLGASMPLSLTGGYSAVQFRCPAKVSLNLRKIANLCIGNLICAQYRFICLMIIDFSEIIFSGHRNMEFRSIWNFYSNNRQFFLDIYTQQSDIVFALMRIRLPVWVLSVESE